MTGATQVYYIDDCIEGMAKRVPPGTADFVFADPPFNIGFGGMSSFYGYGVSKDAGIYYSDSMTKEEYLAWCDRWIKASYDALRDDGILVIMSGWSWSSYLEVMARDRAGFDLLNEVTWRFEFGPHASRKFTSSHYNFKVLVKGNVKNQKYTFHKLKSKGSEEDVIRDIKLFMEEKDGMERKRRVLAIATIIESMLSKRDDMGPLDLFDDIRRLTKRYTGIKHPCKLNEEVIEKFYRHFTNEGDLVVDMFAGAGTGLVAASHLGRNYIGFEIEPSYEEAIREMMKKRDVTGPRRVKLDDFF